MEPKNYLSEEKNRRAYNNLIVMPNMFKNELLIAAQNKQKYRLFNNNNVSRLRMEAKRSYNNNPNILSRSVDASLQPQIKNSKIDQILAARRHFESNKNNVRTNTYKCSR